MHAEHQSGVNGAIEVGGEEVEGNDDQLESTIIESLLEQLKAKDALIEKLTDKLATTAERPLPRFLDIGWGAFNAELIEAVGVWAEEQDTPNGPVTDVETPRIRVRGESFKITFEAMLAIQRELGVQPPPATNLHDKFAALVDDDSCLNKAQFGEPIFILRAQDELSSELVRLWADKAEEHGCTASKVEEARLVADMMENYPGRKFPD